MSSTTGQGGGAWFPGGAYPGGGAGGPAAGGGVGAPVDPGAAPSGIAGRGPSPAPAEPPQSAPQDRGTHAAIGLPRALGVPPAGSHYRRSPVATPFDLRALPAIERSSVELFDLVCQTFPRYLRTPALADAVSGFLGSFLSPESEGGQELVLEVKDQKSQETRTERFTEPEVLIGSHVSASLRVQSAMVSRRHARIVHEDGAYQLIDQGSSNGTLLRGERVQAGYAYALKNGETFSVPGTEITVRWEEEKPAPKLKGLRVTGLRLEAPGAFIAGVPRQGVVAVVRLEPGGGQALVELGPEVCHLLCARILGAEGGLSASAVVPLRPLGEVEKGCLELVLVKLVDAVQQAWGPEAELTLHLGAVLDGGDAQIGGLLEGKSTVVAGVGLEFDSRRDAVRIAVPRAALGRIGQQLARSTTPGGEAPEELFCRYRDVAGLWRTSLAVTAGRMRLTRRQIRELEDGSILFPDALDLSIGEAGVQGTLELMVAGGSGRARVRARLTTYAPTLCMEIEEIFVGAAGRPEASGGAMTEQQAAGAAATEEELGPGAAMLDDVPVPMVVELGRLSVTLRDLAHLRHGQVLELGRGADDPVSLVVDGHLVGTGKLVNVEGEIGVQVLEMLR